MPIKRGNDPVRSVDRHLDRGYKGSSSSSSDEQLGPRTHSPKHAQFKEVAAAEVTPRRTSQSYEPSLEYSDYHLWSPSMHVLAANRDHERSQRSPMNFSLRPRTLSGQDRETFLPMTSFTYYKSGHSIISCPDQSRASPELSFFRYQLANFDLLEDWQKAWLKRVDKLPPILHGPPSTATSPVP